jgi:hypothetical protein
MPGAHALAHIRETVGCSPAAAIKQLQSSISDGAVSARLPDPKDPSRNAIFPPWANATIYGPGGSPMLSPGIRQFPSRKEWQNATLRTNGTAQFFEIGGQHYRFEVRRENVLPIWSSEKVHKPKRAKARPVSDAIDEAIRVLWPNGIPRTLRAKQRNEQIKKWLKENNCHVGSDTALARAVQRAIKRRSK